VSPRTPEDPSHQLAALALLRPANGPFVLRLHRFFWSEGEAGVQRFLALAKRYTANALAQQLGGLPVDALPSTEQTSADIVVRVGTDFRGLATDLAR